MTDQPFPYAHANGLPSRVLDVLETTGLSVGRGNVRWMEKT